MSGHPHSSRYARLVSGFAASAFALLITLGMQQTSANIATASIVKGGVTTTSYQLTKCPVKVGDRNFRLLSKMCTTRSLITGR